ncbi:hypothetical protein CPB86DRAFT_777996 [Serendipita vermifera]|nr:hypothetical protein CPB86DRAFT_777996 [Serendipita vermifera]
MTRFHSLPPYAPALGTCGCLLWICCSLSGNTSSILLSPVVPESTVTRPFIFEYEVSLFSHEG